MPAYRRKLVLKIHAGFSIRTDNPDFVERRIEPVDDALDDKARRLRLGISLLPGGDGWKRDRAQSHGACKLHDLARALRQVTIALVEIGPEIRHDPDQNMSGLKIITWHGIHVPDFGFIDMLQNKFVQPASRCIKQGCVKTADMFEILRKYCGNRIDFLIDNIAFHEANFI